MPKKNRENTQQAKPQFKLSQIQFSKISYSGFDPDQHPTHLWQAGPEGFSQWPKELKGDRDVEIIRSQLLTSKPRRCASPDRAVSWIEHNKLYRYVCIIVKPCLKRLFPFLYHTLNHTDLVGPSLYWLGRYSKSQVKFPFTCNDLVLPSPSCKKIFAASKSFHPPITLESNKVDLTWISEWLSHSKSRSWITQTG